MDLFEFSTTSRRIPNCGFLTPPQAGFGMTLESGERIEPRTRKTRRKAGLPRLSQRPVNRHCPGRRLDPQDGGQGALAAGINLQGFGFHQAVAEAQRIRVPHPLAQAVERGLEGPARHVPVGVRPQHVLDLLRPGLAPP